MNYGMGDIGISEDTRALIEELLRKGRLSYGEVSSRFEEEYAEAHDCAFGVLVNSGTSALHLALQAAKEVNGWPDGGRVAIPALTFVAGANVVLHNRMLPVPVDIDIRSGYGMNPEQLENTIKHRSDLLAIMPAHLFGRSAQIEEIMNIAAETDLVVIEDACEASFAKRDGRSVGSWGTMGCHSFYMGHVLSCGVGGMVTMNHPRYHDYVRSLANHGIVSKWLPGNSFSHSLNRRFVFDKIGHSFRLTELEAAIGLGQMSTIEQALAARRRNARYYTELLSSSSISDMLILPPPDDKDEGSHMCFPITILPSAAVTKTMPMEMLAKAGIATRDLVPLLDQPCYWDTVWSRGKYPQAEIAATYGFYIPCHHRMSLNDVEEVASTLIQILEVFG